jgi:hypothetical protein
MQSHKFGLMLAAALFFAAPMGASPALALSVNQETLIDMIRDINRPAADRLEDGLKRIEEEGLDKKTREKKNAEFIKKQLKKVSKQMEDARKAGVGLNPLDINRVVQLHWTLYYASGTSYEFLSHFRDFDMGPEFEIKRDEILERRKQAEADAKPPESQSQLIIRPEAGIGHMNIGHFNALRTEIGGNVVSPNFGAVDIEGGFQDAGFEVEFLEAQTILLFGNEAATSIFMAIDWGFLDWSDVYVLDADGNRLGVLGPEGPGGFFGGGVVTAPGFGDVTDGYFNGDYHEGLIQLGGKASWQLDFGQLTARAGTFYGWTSMDMRYGGTTNGGTFDFAYSSGLKTDRVGVQIGLGMEAPLIDTSSGVYMSFDARAIENFAEGHIALDTAIGSERQEIDDTRFDVGGKIEGGLYWEPTNDVSMRLGGSYETWRAPVPKVTGEVPAYIDWESRNSWTAQLTVEAAFPK